MCFIKSLKPCRTPCELGELWKVEYEVVEEVYPDGVKQRDIDPGHEVLQVFADSFELNTSESREDGAIQRRMPAFRAGARKTGFESNGKVLEVG
jgi:hypothetical protein